MGFRWGRISLIDLGRARLRRNGWGTGRLRGASELDSGTRGGVSRSFSLHPAGWSGHSPDGESEDQRERGENYSSRRDSDTMP